MMDEENPQISDEDQRRDIKLKNFANVAYLLLGLGLFTVGLTALISLALCYSQRQKEPTSWVSTHFTWIIQTIWYFFCVFLIGYFMLQFQAGTIPVLGLLLLVGSGAWLLFRIFRGWMGLANDLKMFDS